MTDLLASFDNEDVDVAEISNLIARDQGLTARFTDLLIHFMACKHKVRSINEAVVVLGFQDPCMVLAVGKRHFQG